MKSTWFKYYGKLWRIARMGSYGFNYRIIAVGMDGEIWDKLGHLSDTDGVIRDAAARSLDVEHPEIVKRCKEVENR